MVLVYQGDETFEDLVQTGGALGIGILPGFVHLLRPYVGGQIGEGSQERADDFLFVRERGADEFSGQV